MRTISTLALGAVFSALVATGAMAQGINNTGYSRCGSYYGYSGCTGYYGPAYSGYGSYYGYTSWGYNPGYYRSIR